MELTIVSGNGYKDYIVRIDDIDMLDVFFSRDDVDCSLSERIYQLYELVAEVEERREYAQDIS